MEEQGLCIVERNYRCRIGEIDLIAKDGETLVFVEVKYRRNTQQGSALQAVDTRKQRTITKVASWYLAAQASDFYVSCRFDVVAFDGSEVTWISDAFEAQF